MDGGVARVGFEWLDQDLDGLGDLDQWSGWAGPGLGSPHSGSPWWKNGLRGGEGLGSHSKWMASNGS